MRQFPHKKIKRLSRRQEVALANDTGSRVQTGSGALPWAKGDVRKKGKFRAECKFTRAKSYSVTIETLNKIRSECASDETPVLDLQFLDKHGAVDERWVLVPYEVWIASQKGD
jgi:uncharacterized protein (AIM24 family)